MDSPLTLLVVALLVIAAPASPRQAVAPPAPEAEAAVTLQSAQRLIASGHLAEATQQLDTLAAQKPEPAGTERVRGLALYQQNDMPGAEAAFAKAAMQDPADTQSVQMRGVALFRMGKPAEAIPYLERTHRSGQPSGQSSEKPAAGATAAPKSSLAAANVDTNYVLGLCYMDTRRYDEARGAFATEYGFRPESAEAYLLAARLLFRREYTPAAEESARKAVALQPNLPLAHALLGEIALAKSQIPESIAEFEKERSINPLYGGLYDRLGDAYARSGEYAKAQEALDRAVLLEPTSTGPYILLGKVLLKQHDPATATMYLERAAHMDPNNYMTHSLLGQAYRAAGRNEEATRETQLSEQLQASTTPRLSTPKAETPK